MRRGFTLIEVIVVCAVLGMLSAIIIPNVVTMKQGRERQEAYKDVLRLAQMGRETAIQSGKGYVLTLNGTTVELKRDTETLATRSGTKDDATADTSTNVKVATLPTGTILGGGTVSGGQSSGDTTVDGASADLPSGTTLGQVVLDDKPSTSTDFTLHFYPDGRSEGGGFEMDDNGGIRSLSVDRNGFATMLDGSLPATAESTWEAGEYEQRASS